jgi:hypothetical protein
MLAVEVGLFVFMERGGACSVHDLVARAELASSEFSVAFVATVVISGEEVAVVTNVDASEKGGSHPYRFRSWDAERDESLAPASMSSYS